MSSASPPAAAVTRQPVHHRAIQMRSYLRSDGLWDIEATLADVRGYDSVALERMRISAGDAVHDIRVCVTLDNEMVVQSVTATMKTVPYHACPGALAALDNMAGARIGPGWRREIEQRLGGSLCCTHIRELLANIATTAYQTIPVWHAQAQGDIIKSKDGQPPQHLGQCTAWAFNGAVVARHYPQFVNWSAGRAAAVEPDSSSWSQESPANALTKPNGSSGLFVGDSGPS